MESIQQMAETIVLETNIQMRMIEIPIYKKMMLQNIHFSGRRAPTKYKNEFGEHSRDNGSGYRGLYRTKDGTIINSDLNESANIGRKAIPDMFTMKDALLPDFNNIKVYKQQ